MNTLLVVLSIIVALVSLVGSIFMMGKIIGAMTEAIRSATAIFTEKIQNLTDDIKDLKETNKELTTAINYISTQQMVSVETTIARIDESSKSAHQRMNSMECRVARLEDKA